MVVGIHRKIAMPSPDTPSVLMEFVEFKEAGHHLTVHYGIQVHSADTFHQGGNMAVYVP